MKMNAIAPIKTDVIKILKRCKKPQKYINESTYRVRPVLNQEVEYFSPFASTGVKINKTV